MYDANECGQRCQNIIVFSRRDNLQRQIQLIHNQYAGALKRPAAEGTNDRPVPKNRRTQEMNHEDFYALKVLKETNVPKVRVTKLPFKNLM